MNSIPPSVRASVSVVAWIACSSGLILFNKRLLSGWFPYPIILTFFHMLFASIVTWTLRSTGVIKTQLVTLQIYRTKIVPIAALFALSLILSNYAYLYITVSFIQMLKASTPIVVLLLSFAFKLKQPSSFLFSVVFAVCFGVAMAAYGEIMFNFLGVAVQIGGILVEASRLVSMQIVLSEIKLGPLDSLTLYAPACAIFLLIAGLLTGELWTAFSASIHLFELLLNVSVAFALNLATLWLVLETSSLVLTLCGVFKDILLIFLSKIIFASVFTKIQVLGYTISLIGIYVYNQFGSQPPPAPSDVESGSSMHSNNRHPFISYLSMENLQVFAKSRHALFTAFIILFLIVGLQTATPTTGDYKASPSKQEIKIPPGSITNSPALSAQPVDITQEEHLAEITSNEIPYGNGAFEEEEEEIEIPDDLPQAAPPWSLTGPTNSTFRIEDPDMRNDFLNHFTFAITATHKFHDRIQYLMNSWWTPDIASIVEVFSDQPESGQNFPIPNLIDTKCDDSYINGVWCKMTYILKEWTTNPKYKNVQWFYRANDDSWVHMENLHWLVQGYNYSEPIIIGEKDCDVTNKDYPDGGPGFIISRAVIDQWDWKHWEAAWRWRHTNEDLLWGHYITGVGNIQLYHYWGITHHPLHNGTEIYQYFRRQTGKMWPATFRPVAYHQIGDSIKLMPEISREMHLINFNTIHPRAYDPPRCTCIKNKHLRCGWNDEVTLKQCGWSSPWLKCIGPGPWINREGGESAEIP